MSMVTPPVALAAYTAASIAESPILRTAFAAFSFSLVGFALPFLFVYRPQLLMLAPDGGSAGAGEIVAAFGLAALGILPFAAAIAGYLSRPLGPAARTLLFVAAAGIFFPAGSGDGGLGIGWPNMVGGALLVVMLVALRKRSAD